MLAMLQNRLDHAKRSAADALKTSSKRVIQKTAETTGDLTGNKIANRITKVSKNSQEINSETVTNEHDEEIPNEKYISPEERQEIIDELKLKLKYNNKISENNKSFKKIHNKIIQKKLQIRMIKKYLKKDIYLQKKGNKLLII